MELRFSGVKYDDAPVNLTRENVKAAAEKTKEVEEKNTILNKVGEASKIIEVVGDLVKEVSTSICLVTFT